MLQKNFRVIFFKYFSTTINFLLKNLEYYRYQEKSTFFEKITLNNDLII